MTKVYVLQHVHTFEDGAEDVKFIGVYSSRENAQAAITRQSQASGFSDAPGGFHIDEYQVDKDQWVEGYSTHQELEKRAAQIKWEQLVQTHRPPQSWSNDDDNPFEPEEDAAS